MPDSPSAVLPKRLPHGPLKPTTAIKVAPLLLEAAGSEPDEVLQKLQTTNIGLSEDEARRRLEKFGPNVVAREQQHTRLRLLGKALVNPLVILLLVLATS